MYAHQAERHGCIECHDCSKSGAIQCRIVASDVIDRISCPRRFRSSARCRACGAGRLAIEPPENIRRVGTMFSTSSTLVFRCKA